MDKHEKGVEVDPLRLDLPLPRWDGKYRGDPKRLPKVVQKLVLRRPLTPEEKAELLWRFYELDQGGRARRGLIGVLLVMFLCAVCIAGYLAYTHRIAFSGMLAPPR
jgi:hypothetical protein